MKIEGTRILVTGAAGHVGGHVVEALLKESPAQVIAVDRGFRDAGAEHADALNAPAVTPVECDITSAEEMRRLIDRVDVVVHTASMLSRDAIADFRRAYEVNIAATFAILEASAAASVRKFVYTSSSSVYDGQLYPHPVKESDAFHPASIYGVGKSASEMLMGVFKGAGKLDCVALRCATIYGRRQSLRSNTARLIPETFDRLAYGLPALLHGDGLQAYDFINVVDVAQAHVAAIRSSAGGSAYNVATGVLTRVSDVIDLIGRICGAQQQTLRQPQEKRYTIPEHRFDVSKAADELGFRASIPLAQGLQDYFDWRRTVRKDEGVAHAAAS
jgi:UDP-glucose 4-epimerase